MFRSFVGTLVGIQTDSGCCLLSIVGRPGGNSGSCRCLLFRSFVGALVGGQEAYLGRGRLSEDFIKVVVYFDKILTVAVQMKVQESWRVFSIFSFFRF